MSSIVTHSVEGTCLRFALAGRIDETLPSQIRELVSNEQLRRLQSIHLDFKEILRLSSQELGVLALLLTDSVFAEKHIEFHRVNPRVIALLHLVGIDHLVQVILEGSPGDPDSWKTETLPEIVCGSAKEKDWHKIVVALKSELTRAKQDNVDLNRQLVHSEKVGMLGLLAGGVSHEFNNLICIISGYAELAMTEAKGNISVQKSLSVIEESCDRAAVITEALLSFSRRKKPVKNSTDLTKILDRQINLLTSKFLAADIQVETFFEGSVCVLADASQMEQVFMNLLVNAIHAMPQGGTLTVATEVTGNCAFVRVADTGIGIEKKNLENIFAPFFTTKGALAGGDVKGTGLGLSVSQGIIANHNGTINVESKLGVGTTFTIFLPLTKRPVLKAKSLPTVKSKTDDTNEIDLTEPVSKQALTILVVDDEPSIRDFLQRHLFLQGHTVLLAPDGETAIQICRETKPDVILLDMLMPGMNGADTLLEINRIHQDIAVAVITGQAGKSLEAMLEVMKGAGNISLIRKPFKVKDIIAFLDTVVIDRVS